MGNREKCPWCNRLVSVVNKKLAKHRIKRGKQGYPVCRGPKA